MTMNVVALSCVVLIVVTLHIGRILTLIIVLVKMYAYIYIDLLSSDFGVSVG